MPDLELLTGEDLEALADTARTGTDPLVVVAELVRAVDDGLIADPGEVGFALTLASEIIEESGDLDAAIALAERAVAANAQNGDGNSILAEPFLAELLGKAGRPDEGVTLLTALRPVMSVKPQVGAMVAEALETLGEVETAVEWLTEALTLAIADEAKLDDDDDEEIARATTVVYDLAQCRHRLRGELGLDHDDLDELADELRETLESMDEPEPMVFWPEPDFEALTAASAGLAEEWEPSWDEHRSLLEAQLQRWSEAGHQDLVVMVGSAEGLVEFALRQGVTTVDTDVGQAYLEHLLESPDARELVWPPPRNGTCWCGSGAKYKKCCLPRGRT